MNWILAMRSQGISNLYTQRTGDPMCKKVQSTLFAFVLVGLLFTGHLAAQGFQGTLRGNVQDQTGALVPGATITLTGQETGETRTQQSTDSGTFAFPALLVGDYTVAVELSGFKRYERKDVHVSANQVVDLTAKLELGEV